jgi:hypothetical protein
MVNQYYTKYLNQFESVLGNYGYLRNKEETVSSKLYNAHLSVEYINNRLQRRASIDYTEWTDSNVLISMTMYKIPKEDSFFSLFDFLNKHDLRSKIKSEHLVTENFENFIKKYFEDLESLFQNELNDQITGKSFENHRDLLNQSWNEHSDIFYEMEKSVVDEYKKI